MKHIFSLGLFLAIATFTFAQGTSGTTGTTTTTAKKKTTNDNTISDWSSFSKSGNSIQYPQDWTLDESGQMNTSFIVFSPQTSMDDMFKENINLLVQDLSIYGMANLTLDEYTQLSLAQMPNIISNYALISSERKTNRGKTYQEVEYTGTQMGYSLMWKQRVLLEGGKAYILTFTSEQTQYINYKDIATKIMDSFKM